MGRTIGPKELRYLHFVHKGLSIHFVIEYEPGFKDDAISQVESYLSKAYDDIQGQDYTLKLFSFTVKSEAEREAIKDKFKVLDADWSKLASKSPGVWTLVHVPDSPDELSVAFAPSFLASPQVHQLIHVIAFLTVADSQSKRKV